MHDITSVKCDIGGSANLCFSLKDIKSNSKKKNRKKTQNCTYFKLGFPFAKFLKRKRKFFLMLHYIFAQNNDTLRSAIIPKLHFAQNCTILLLHYYVLHNFAEQIFSKRLNKGLHQIDSSTIDGKVEFAHFQYSCIFTSQVST